MLIYEKLKDFTVVFNVILTRLIDLTYRPKKTEHIVRFLLVLIVCLNTIQSF